MEFCEFIVEDGSCVVDANTFATIDCARGYWSNRFGGEKWDKSFKGENYCDADIKKALIGAIDYLNAQNWGQQMCRNSCVPTPINCSCTGKSAVELLKEAQIVLADAILKGWRPYGSSRASSPLITSISSPDEGSVTFARPTSLACYNGMANTDDIGREVLARVRGLLRPLIGGRFKGRRVIS